MEIIISANEKILFLITKTTNDISAKMSQTEFLECVKEAESMGVNDSEVQKV